MVCLLWGDSFAKEQALSVIDHTHTLNVQIGNTSGNCAENIWYVSFPTDIEKSIYLLGFWTWFLRRCTALYSFIATIPNISLEVMI